LFDDRGGVFLILSFLELRVEGCSVDVLDDGFVVGAVFAYGCKAGHVFLEY
jgi:hypothetical protein